MKLVISRDEMTYCKRNEIQTITQNDDISCLLSPLRIPLNQEYHAQLKDENRNHVTETDQNANF